jgi:hypothetical protein
MQYDEWNCEQEAPGVKRALGELVTLAGCVRRNPEIAELLALELSELSRRYIENSKSGIEFSAMIPVAVWDQFQAAMRAAGGCLDGQSCYEELQDILFKGMQDRIMQSVREE